jgi:hypothetical protein
LDLILLIIVVTIVVYLFLTMKNTEYRRNQNVFSKIFDRKRHVLSARCMSSMLKNFLSANVELTNEIKDRVRKLLSCSFYATIFNHEWKSILK